MTPYGGIDMVNIGLGNDLLPDGTTRYMDQFWFITSKAQWHSS